MHSDLPVEGAELDAADVAPDPDAFVYFVDPEELALLSPGWPEEMRLLLCMDATGLCEFVVFHDEEEPRIFGRVTEILDRPVGAFAVSPQVEGYPTRRLLFSEENALLKSIQDSSSLRETAEDYLINYNFAREESLDFEKLMRTRRVDDDSLAARVRTDKIFAFGSKNAPKKRAPQSSPPAGYLSTEELSGDESITSVWRCGLSVVVSGLQGRSTFLCLRCRRLCGKLPCATTFHRSTFRATSCRRAGIRRMT